MLSTALLAASCVQALGVRELPGTCGAIAYADVACASCADASCCAEAEACAREPSCSAAVACRAACAPTDAGCRARCGDASSEAASRFEACRRARCGDPCFACTEYVPADVESPCASCAATQCCEQTRACAASPGCDALASCTSVCHDPTCIGACLARSDLSSRDRVVDLTKCSAGCAACVVGESWGCVDSYAIPLPVATTARWTVELALYPSTKLDGIGVDLCGWTDAACSAPLEHATARAGVASFALPLNVSSGFTGYLRVGTDLPNLLSMGRVVRDGFERWVLLDKKVASAALATVGGTLQEGVDAAVLMIAEDCKGATAPGVTFELDPPYDAEKVYYLGANTPSSVAVATNQSGIAAAVLHAKNGALPADRLGVRGHLEGKPGVAVRGEAALQSGTLSQVIVAPTPSN